MLKNIIQIVATLVLLPSLVLAQTQKEHAEYIGALSQVDRFDNNVFSQVSNRTGSANTNRRSNITISGCELTVKSTSFLPAHGMWEGLLTTIDITVLEIDERTTLDGKTRRFIHWPSSGDNSSGSTPTAAFGTIQFFFEKPGQLYRFTSRTEIPLAEMTTADGTEFYMMHTATYHNERNPTEEDMSALVHEILAYQERYCSPAS